MHVTPKHTHTHTRGVVEHDKNTHTPETKFAQNVFQLIFAVRKIIVVVENRNRTLTQSTAAQQEILLSTREINTQ